MTIYLREEAQAVNSIIEVLLKSHLQLPSMMAQELAFYLGDEFNFKRIP